MRYATRSPTLPLLAAAGLMAASLGCDDGRSTYRPYRSQKKVERFQSSQKSFLLDSKDFDLEAVLALIRANKVNNAEELEARVNGDTGINNVDVDDDDQIDYVMVKEADASSSGTTLEFWAVPSKSQDVEQAKKVASTTFSKTSEHVQVTGRYPSHVRGYDHHYYSYRRPGLSFGEAMFLMWAFDRSRPSYYRPMYVNRYVPRRVYTSSVLTNRRATHRSTHGLSPVPVSTRSTASSPSRTQPSRYGTPSNSPSASKKLSDRKNTVKSYERRPPERPKSLGTGFGASGSTKKSASKSSGFGSSGTSGSKSSGWGSSSSRSKSSSWGSSGSRSSSRRTSRRRRR